MLSQECPRHVIFDHEIATIEEFIKQVLRPLHRAVDIAKSHNMRGAGDAARRLRDDEEEGDGTEICLLSAGA